MVAVGEPAEIPFDDGRMAAAFRWLAQADWLDDVDWPPTSAKSRRALSIEKIFPSLRELLIRSGDLGFMGPPFASPAGGVGLSSLLVALSYLRAGLLLNTAVQVGDYDRIRSFLLTDPKGWSSSGSLGVVGAEFENQHFAMVAAARLWVASYVVANLDTFGLRATMRTNRIGGPYRIAAASASPWQLLWLVLAVSIGAIEPPFPMPGVRVCEYPTCGEVFITARNNVRGKRRFCTPRCGRSFHAAKTTDAKRAAARAARHQQQQED
jgi:hypothetical protein